MLGKFFGSEFGKGLVAGAAKGFEKGFADDIERTKDNVDRLVLTSYEGGVESKKEFDKVYKENRKIVDKIIANLGGAQGADNPRAVDAAQGLIADQGLEGALSYSENLSGQFQLLGRDPIKSLGLAQRTNHSTPLTADLLTKSTVPPVAIPNIKELAKSADVGIMKFFGDDDYTPSTVESQAKALLRARGIDPNKGDLNLPPALSVKIDPLIAGMQNNPVNEIIRLQNYLEDNEDTMDATTENKVKDMIQAQQSIINRQNAVKNQRIPGPLNETEEGHYRKFIIGEITDKFNIKVKRNDFTGAYISIGEKNNKRALVIQYVNNLIRQLGDAATKGILSKQGNFMTVVSEAIYGDKKLIVVDGELVTDDTNKFFSEDDSKILGKGTNPIKPVIEGKTKTNAQLIQEIKDAGGKNTTQGTKLFNELVDTIMKNKKIQFRSAQSEALNLLK
jgi:arsenate reductase-like glutaredoxin family protein